MKASIDLTIKVVGDEVEDVRIWAWLADGRHFGCHTEFVDPIGEGESYTYSYTIEGEEVEKLLAATGAKDDPSQAFSTTLKTVSDSAVSAMSTGSGTASRWMNDGPFHR